MIQGTTAIAVLTWREAWRGRLWLVPLAAAGLIAVMAPRVQAADAGGAVRLLAAGADAAAAFCAILVAALVPASQLSRDLDSRIVLTVFPKPQPRASWILGRWLGTVLIALAASLFVALAGSAAVAWRSGGVPGSRAIVATPVGFHRITGLGEAVPAASDHAMLAGPAGDGARWRFTGLDPASAATYEVLLRVRVRGGEVDAVPVRVSALNGSVSALALSLDAASPYGQAPTAANVPGATCWMIDRQSDRRSLVSDWARLRLPPGAIAADGSLQVEMTRLDAAAGVEVAAGSCAIAAPAGPQPLHAARAVLAELAAPAVVAAAALAVATVASLPVAMLAALTLAFAGNALWAVREAIVIDKPGQVVVRLLELALNVIPDLGRTGQGVRLAAGEAVAWGDVGSAWIGVAPHLLVLLMLGWWALSRRQL